MGYSKKSRFSGHMGHMGSWLDRGSLPMVLTSAILERLGGPDMRGVASGSPGGHPGGKWPRPVGFSFPPAKRRQLLSRLRDRLPPWLPLGTLTKEEEKKKKQYREYPQGRWFIGPRLTNVRYKRYGRKRKFRRM